jgi:hypothetical protein
MMQIARLLCQSRLIGPSAVPVYRDSVHEGLSSTLQVCSMSGPKADDAIDYRRLHESTRKERLERVLL